MADATALGLGLASLALLVVWTAAFLGAHLVRPTTWSPIRNAVSEYGVLPHKTAPWIWVCWWTIAGVAALLAAGLGHILVVLAPASGVSGSGTAAITLLAVFGLARILTSLFPTDMSENAPDDVQKVEVVDRAGQQRFVSGRLHFFFALVSFVTIVVASFQFAAAFKKPPYASTHLGEHAGLLKSIAWAELAAAILMSLGLRFFRSYCGALERLFYLAHILWLYTATVLLIQSAFDL